MKPTEIVKRLKSQFYNAHEVWCAGCGTHLGYRADEEHGSADVYCDGCAEQMMQRPPAGEWRPDILDKLNKLRETSDEH